MAQTVEEILAGAKKTLAGADALSAKVEAEKPKPDAPPKAAGPLGAVTSNMQHEYSNAPYKLAAPKKPAAKPKGELSKSLDWNAQQRKVAEAQ